MSKGKKILPFILLFLLVGAAVAGYWFYRGFGPDMPFNPLAKTTQVTLPVAVSLTNREGKTIDAILIGRSATEVSLKKPDDPKNTVYTVAIVKLSEKDQRFLERVPIVEYHPPKADSPVIAARKKVLEQLEAKVARLDLELKSGGNGLRPQGWGAAKSREIVAVEAEIKKVKADILLLQKQQAK